MRGPILHVGLSLGGLLVPVVLVAGWLGSAEASLAGADPAAKGVAVASLADEGYCTAGLKQILRRVAGACGLLAEQGRGCRPTDAAQVASLSGEDFNALFLPMAERVHIIQFDKDSDAVDEGAMKAIEAAWGDRRGASFFFVVSRASPEGSLTHNRELSERRARSVLDHLERRFADPEIRRQVGLLWLGEEFAQLTDEFCRWTRSRAGSECTANEINRSAFVAWIDCAI